MLLYLLFSDLLQKGIQALIADPSFSLDIPPAKYAYGIAEKLLRWLQYHKEIVAQFEGRMASMFDACIVCKGGLTKSRKQILAAYHALRVSDSYKEEWRHLLRQGEVSDINPTFYQFVGHNMFTRLVMIHHPITIRERSAPPPLTYEETNALRYVDGFIPRMLRKRLSKSTHPLREDIILCIHDLLDDGDEQNDETQDWVHSVDRGGLTLVNNVTFDVFIAIEGEIQNLLGKRMELTDEVKTSICESDNVIFCWSLVCGDWEDNCSAALLQMIVNQYTKIRGYSLMLVL